jgi:hypothetical protein
MTSKSGLTEAGAIAQREYFLELGRFVSMFALVETIVFFTLRRYTGVNKTVAKAVFSGVQIETAMSFIKRTMDGKRKSPELIKDITFVFDQLGVIKGARNSILHYGAHAVENNVGYVTNIVTHPTKRATVFPISPKILSHMTHDCRKIVSHLLLNHDPRPSTPDADAEMLQFVNAPWRYKHSEQLVVANKARAKSPKHRKRTVKQIRQR